MRSEDEWGKDPTVMAMRKVFREIEASQGDFFGCMKINKYDTRIRAWREKSLALFERAFYRTDNTGLIINEKNASIIYLNCLAHVMRAQGINIPEACLPEATGDENFLEERF